MDMRKNKQTGFTIIETMVAMSVFLVVVMVGMGSLLSASVVHQKSQDMRSIMDNLSFALDDISRSARTGQSFSCSPNCTSARSITFIDPDDNIINYSIVNDSSSRRFLQKKINSNQEVNLTLSEIDLDFNSGFIIKGESSGDTRQPYITIMLSGDITYKDVVTPFSIQTSVSQRLVDII